MKPTVSDRIAVLPDGRSSRRIVGSSVANSMSSAPTADAGQPVEQRRFAGIGVADQRHHRIRHAAARLAMQAAGALDVVELALQPGDALADQPAVDFELAFAGAAEKAEAAALAFEMGPRPHQPRALIRQRRQLDLQPAFMGAGARAEDFEDQAGAVDDLGLPAPFEIALLHRRQRPVDDDEPDLVLGDQLAAASRHCRCRAGCRAPGARRARSRARDDVEIDRPRQPDRLVEPRIDRARRLRRRARRDGAVFNAG